METLVLIDKLDDILHKARPVPLTDQVRVDKHEIYDILDRMRAAFPEDVRQGRQGSGTSSGGLGSSGRDELVAAVRAAVESVLRENIPAIAQAAAAAARGAAPPPGGPF